MPGLNFNQKIGHLFYRFQMYNSFLYSFQTGFNYKLNQKIFSIDKIPFAAFKNSMLAEDSALLPGPKHLSIMQYSNALPAVTVYIHLILL